MLKMLIQYCIFKVKYYVYKARNKWQEARNSYHASLNHIAEKGIPIKKEGADNDE